MYTQSTRRRFKMRAGPFFILGQAGVTQDSWRLTFNRIMAVASSGRKCVCSITAARDISTALLQLRLFLLLLAHLWTRSMTSFSKTAGTMNDAWPEQLRTPPPSEHSETRSQSWAGGS